MKFDSPKEFSFDIRNILLKKIFKQIKKRNYYLDEDKYIGKMLLEGDAVFLIEDFFIRNSNIEYFYTKNHELPLNNPRKKDDDHRSMKYYQISHEYYQTLKRDTDKFLDIHFNKDAYYDESNTSNEKKNIFLHSIEIVRRHIEILHNIQPKLYDEIEEYLVNFETIITAKDFRQNKYSGLESFIKVLEDSKTNFIIDSQEGEKYYPIIVDIFLDYAHIMDILNSYDNDLKNKRKRYKYFRDKLVKSNDDIDPTFYYLIKFTKLERIDNVKRYILKFYLETFNNNKNINILFRKLFVGKLKERKDYSPANMKDYKPKIHLIFNILTNSKYFL